MDTPDIDTPDDYLNDEILADELPDEPLVPNHAKTRAKT